MRFFQSSRPGFDAKIYPLLGFDSPLEYLPKTTIPITTHHVHLVDSLENPLMGSLPLQHFGITEFPRIGIASPI
jgi:hypothetical protein